MKNDEKIRLQEPISMTMTLYDLLISSRVSHGHALGFIPIIY